jgi:hypothetical protein
MCHREGSRNQMGLKLNGAQQLLAYADDMNPLGDYIDTTYKEAHRKYR